MNYITTDRGIEAEASYRETCKKCGGRGQFVSWSGRILGRCFACKGVGYKEFKTRPEQRAQARAASAARRVRSTIENVACFAGQYPAEAKWLDEAAARGFEFAQSLKGKVEKYGELTDNQIAAIARCMDGDSMTTYWVEASQFERYTGPVK